MAYSGGVSVGSPPSLPGGGKGISSGYTYTNKYTLPKTPAPRPIRGGITAAPTSTVAPTSVPQNTGNSGGASSDPYAGLDATYAANTATNLFDTRNKINALTTQGANNEVALQSALAQLSGQLPYDQLKEQYSAEQGGGLYSSVYGQNQGRIAQAEADQALGLTTNAANQATDIANQQAALTAGIPLFNDQEAAASYLRAAAALAKDPAAVVPSTPATKPVNGTFSNTGTGAVPPPPSGPGTPGSKTGPSIAGTFGRGTDWYKTATRAEAASGRRAARSYAVHPAVSALAKALAAKKRGG